MRVATAALVVGTMVIGGGSFSFATPAATAPSTELVSRSGAGDPVSAVQGSISDDGRYVAFATAEALVPVDTNGRSDIYVRDLLLGTDTLASASSTGEVGNGDSG